MEQSAVVLGLGVARAVRGLAERPRAETTLPPVALRRCVSKAAAAMFGAQTSDAHAPRGPSSCECAGGTRPRTSCHRRRTPAASPCDRSGCAYGRTTCGTVKANSMTVRNANLLVRLEKGIQKGRELTCWRRSGGRCDTWRVRSIVYSDGSSSSSCSCSQKQPVGWKSLSPAASAKGASHAGWDCRLQEYERGPPTLECLLT